MRREMVDQQRGETYMTVKQHFDDMVSETEHREQNSKC